MAWGGGHGSHCLLPTRPLLAILCHHQSRTWTAPHSSSRPSSLSPWFILALPLPGTYSSPPSDSAGALPPARPQTENRPVCGRSRQPAAPVPCKSRPPRPGDALGPGPRFSRANAGPALLCNEETPPGTGTKPSPALAFDFSGSHTCSESSHFHVAVLMQFFSLRKRTLRKLSGHGPGERLASSTVSSLPSNGGRHALPPSPPPALSPRARGDAVTSPLGTLLGCGVCVSSCDFGETRLLIQ